MSGVYQGAAPSYPRNIASAARQLKEAGATPGITIDPLAANPGNQEGAAWYDPRNAKHENAITDIVEDLIDEVD